MFPREHGAYGQLLFPLLTALAVGRASGPALALSAAAIGAFVAHEPLLVLLGRRGQRAAREQRPRALRWLLGSAAIAASFGVASVASMPPAARQGLLVPVVLAAGVALAILLRRERTVAGEMLSAAALSSLSYPVALAAGASPIAARTCAIVFAAAFVAPTAAVHAVIQQTRKPPATASRASACLGALAAVAILRWLSGAGVVAPTSMWAALPACAAAAVFALVAPPARRLRLLGWTLVAASAAAAVMLVSALR